ncbi:MAG: branched-chain amino acid ABC transporter substrate-binding protein [Magnetospirillum sp.]|nr:MAG: branched-chain amino acid ABC transporter substrate-binding protein [Magnetospirillum sp.]
MSRTKLLALAVTAAALFAGGATRAEITIGMAGPITGSEAAIGEQFRRGALKAVEDINAKGGVLGQKLVIAIGDDACDPKQAVAVANEMASKKVPFVAGHYCSGSSIPASDVYAETGILQISPASTNPKYTERGLPNVFRVCGRDDQQGKAAADYIAKHFKGKNVAIIHDKSQYGKGLADQTRDYLGKRGIKEVLYEAYTAGEKDYSALVTKLKAAKIDLLYLGGYKTEGGLIVRQMRDQGLQTTLMGGDALMTEEYWSITGSAGQGTLMTFSPDPRKIPGNAELVKYYHAQNYEPEAYTLYTYATVQTWVAAVEKAKTTDWKKVAAVLKSESFDTALGKMAFDAKGDAAAPGYVVYVWKDGKYDYAD